MSSALTAEPGIASRQRSAAGAGGVESRAPEISRWRFAELPGRWAAHPAASCATALIAERGSCEVRIGANGPLLLDPGVSVVVPAGSPSSVRRLTVREPEGIAIAVPGSVDAFPGSREAAAGLSFAPGICDWLGVLPAVQAILGCRGDAADGHRVAAFVETALASRPSAAAENRSRPLAAALRIRTLLVDRFTHRPTLRAIGRVLNLSPFYACHVFRRRFGLSIHQFVVELRVREALTRIANGESQFSALADELGFSSPSHFSETLKRRLGCSATAISRMFDSGGR
jgi:AraC-like DNA-binding protein